MKLRPLVPLLAICASLAIPGSALALPNEPLGTFWTQCGVTEVQTFPDRVHVRYALGATYTFFAAPTSNSAEATRLVTMGTAALTTGRSLWIRANYYDYGAESFGCAQTDCRRPSQVRMN